jgi:hypothetical protein
MDCPLRPYSLFRAFDDPDEQQQNRCINQNMKVPIQREGHHHAQSPDQNQNDGYGPQHGFTSLSK